jgi:hypothetical protein
MTIDQISGASAPYSSKEFVRVFISRFVPVFALSLACVAIAPYAPYQFGEPSSSALSAANAIFLVVVVPLYETVLFVIPVGLLVVNSEKVRANKNIQLIVCCLVGVCFALIHSRPLLHLLPLAPFGILSAVIVMQHWLIDRYGAAFLFCWVAHMIFNAMGVLLDYVFVFTQFNQLLPTD